MKHDKNAGSEKLVANNAAFELKFGVFTTTFWLRSLHVLTAVRPSASASSVSKCDCGLSIRKRKQLFVVRSFVSHKWRKKGWHMIWAHMNSWTNLDLQLAHVISCLFCVVFAVWVGFDMLSLSFARGGMVPVCATAPLKYQRRFKCDTIFVWPLVALL